jgi:hypothetical protein
VLEYTDSVQDFCLDCGVLPWLSRLGLLLLSTPAKAPSVEATSWSSVESAGMPPHKTKLLILSTFFYKQGSSHVDPAICQLPHSRSTTEPGFLVLSHLRLAFSHLRSPNSSCAQVCVFYQW